MRASWRTGFDPYYKRRYGYAKPSPGRYPWQWFWDSCFHAIALSKLDVDMAKQELRSLLMPQRDDGFVGHITFWGHAGALVSAVAGQSRPFEWRRRNTGMIQPPVLAQALLSVWETSDDYEFLVEMLPMVKRYYQWLAHERTDGNDDLIWIVSPYEAGLDNCPAFDAELGLSDPGRASLLWRNWLLDWHNGVLGRGHSYRRLRTRNRFLMIDPFVNAVYADGWHAISIMSEAMDRDDDAATASDMHRRITQSLNDACWDDGEMRWLYLRSNNRVPDRTLAIGTIMPLIIPEQTPAKVTEVVEAHLLNPDEFWTPYPVPSVAVSEPTFDAEGESTIWRGPVCLNLNWLLARGLRQHGLAEAASHVEGKSREMASRDFREFYSPLSGRGLRGTNFGWATVAVDMPTSG